MQAGQTEHMEIKLLLTDEFLWRLYNVQPKKKKKRTGKHKLRYEEQNVMLFVFLVGYINLE
jgi:hypothetical protein